MLPHVWQWVQQCMVSTLVDASPDAACRETASLRRRSAKVKDTSPCSASNSIIATQLRLSSQPVHAEPLHSESGSLCIGATTLDLAFEGAIPIHEYCVQAFSAAQLKCFDSILSSTISENGMLRGLSLSTIPSRNASATNWAHTEVL